MSKRLNGSVVIVVIFPSIYKLNDKFTRVEASIQLSMDSMDK